MAFKQYHSTFRLNHDTYLDICFIHSSFFFFFKLHVPVFSFCLHYKQNILYDVVNQHPHQLSVHLSLYRQYNQLNLWNLNKLQDKCAVINNVSSHYGHLDAPNANCFIRPQISWLTGLETLPPYSLAKDISCPIYSQTGCRYVHCKLNCNI